MYIYKKKTYGHAGTSLAILTGLFLAGTITAVGTANANTEQATEIQPASPAQIVPDQHNSSSVGSNNVGWIRIVTFNAGGGTTVTTNAIDMQAYFESGGANIVQVSLPHVVSAMPKNVANSSSGCFSDLPCNGQWQGWGDKPPGTQPPVTPPTNPSPPTGPLGPVPATPPPPIPPAVSCMSTQATIVTLYPAHKYQLTTVYNRNVYNSGANCSDGPWSNPTNNTNPVKP